MVSFSLRQRIILPPPSGPTPVSFHLSQFVRASDQARCIVRAGGLREMDAGENVGLLFTRLLRPLEGWCPVGAA